MRETVRINDRDFPVVTWGAPAKSIAAKRKAHRVIPRPLDGEPVESGTLTLSMPPPSVNALFFNRKGGGKGRGKTLRYKNWCIDAALQLRSQPSWHVPGAVRVTVRVGGSKGDADNLLKASLDCLVNAGRIQDDRNVVEARAIHDDSVVGTLIEIERAA